MYMSLIIEPVIKITLNYLPDITEITNLNSAVVLIDETEPERQKILSEPPLQ